MRKKRKNKKKNKSVEKANEWLWGDIYEELTLKQRFFVYDKKSVFLGRFLVIDKRK